MADEKSSQECVHSICNCPAAADSDYCSAYCEGAGSEITEMTCECGHSGCAGQVG